MTSRSLRAAGLAGSAGARFRPIADGLLIANVSVRDQGHYECAAVQMSEQVTSQQTRNISLRVRRKYPCPWPCPPAAIGGGRWLLDLDWSTLDTLIACSHKVAIIWRSFALFCATGLWGLERCV